MPIKEKFEDSDSEREDDIALSILANYREGMEKKEKTEISKKKSEDKK